MVQTDSERPIAELLTAKDVQLLLQVDRSTVYRMAESGQLPAIKVGKQWRFPTEQIAAWLNGRAVGPSPTTLPVTPERAVDVTPANLFPLECIQLIQDAFAEVLGVTLVLTDLDGQPITRISNPSPLFQLLAESQRGRLAWQQHMRELAQMPALEPRFVTGHAGLMCARALVRIGNELKAIVVASSMAPAGEQALPQLAGQLADALDLPPARVQAVLQILPVLSADDQKKVLTTVQRIADILAHIGNERLMLLSRLASIARLSALEQPIGGK